MLIENITNYIDTSFSSLHRLHVDMLTEELLMKGKGIKS